MQPWKFQQLYSSCLTFGAPVLVTSGTVSEQIVSEPSITLTVNRQINDSDISFAPHDSASISGGEMDSTIPYEQELPDLYNVIQDSKLFHLEIHRGHCMVELIEKFQDPSLMDGIIEVKMKLPTGKLEKGEGSGVLRDCFTEFWTDFYEKRSEGSDSKIPITRHDFKENEWKAIARVFVKEWEACGYLPIQLALPLLEKSIHGNVESSLTDSFLLYVSKYEKDILEQAVKDYSSVEEDELLDIFSSYQCRRMPSADNINTVLSDIAHHELIQRPTFIIDCWHPILSRIVLTLSRSALTEKVKNSMPTVQGIFKSLSFPEQMNVEERAVGQYLKKFVKSLDERHLKLFLRFCTGADIILSAINVDFIKMSAFEERPIAHTCSNTLHLSCLSSQYIDFVDFKSDWNGVLSSSVWAMDIV